MVGKFVIVLFVGENSNQTLRRDKMSDSEHKSVNTEVLLSKIVNIETLLAQIFKILNGNGTAGLVIKTALHEQRINEIPSPVSLRWYAAAGAGAVTFFGWFGYVLIKIFSSGSGSG
jgi:hypothetical protein